MAVITHQKVNNIAAWTQAELDVQIAAGNFPPGTLLADITLSTDWNSNHSFVLGADENFVTDAQLTIINNTSGTNTGDVSVTDSAEIDFTLAAQNITASLKTGSIDETKLDASVNASLDLADSALQNITGLIDDGTNITITGTGTSGDPYVINASGGGSAAGSSTEVQYNTGGAFDADEFFIRDKSSESFWVGDADGETTPYIYVNGINLGGGGLGSIRIASKDQEVKLQLGGSATGETSFNLSGNGGSLSNYGFSGLVTGGTSGIALAGDEIYINSIDAPNGSVGLLNKDTFGKVGLATAGTDYLEPDGDGSGLTNLTPANIAIGTASGLTAGGNLAFKTIVVAGQSDIVADSTADTLTLVAGTNITITTNAATDTITIATDGDGIVASVNSGTNINVDNTDPAAPIVNLSDDPVLNSISTANFGMSQLDSGGDHYLTIGVAEDLTANRNLSVVVNDANRTLTIAGNATISGSTSGTNTGDQTSVTGNAGTVTFIDAGGDTTCFVALGTAATGSLSPATDAGIIYNATTNALTTTTFIGALTGNADTATTATNVTIGNEATDTTCFPLFSTAATGNLPPKSNTSLTFNSNTVNLACTTFTGALVGNASTATSAATLTTPRTIGAVSFDGSADIVPRTIESMNEATDTTCFPLFITASGTQTLQPKNNVNFIFNSNTGEVGATSFSGAGTGLTGTGASFTAGNVTTNANLTGDVTSTGNATAIAAGVIVNADINASAGIVLSKTNISLTTTGTSGASTLNTTTGVLNIPQYEGLGTIVTQATTSGTEVIFTVDSTTYPVYGVVLTAVSTTAGSGQFFIDVSSDGGSSWATTTYEGRTATGGTFANNAANWCTTGGGTSLSGNLVVAQISTTGITTTTGSAIDPPGDRYVVGGSSATTSAAINRIRFSVISVTFDAGSITIFPIAKR